MLVTEEPTVKYASVIPGLRRNVMSEGGKSSKDILCTNRERLAEGKN